VGLRGYRGRDRGERGSEGLKRKGVGDGGVRRHTRKRQAESAVVFARSLN
jgi:hypothetical protein